MIYAKLLNANEEVFVSILAKSRLEILPYLEEKEGVSPSDFESIVCDQMKEAAKGTDFEGRIEQTGTYAFPDIVANKYFGVEVKVTTSDHWTSTGNSILESSRIADIERIYIFFGKLGGKKDIRYRLYQECLPEISVTHSPRYRINMELDSGTSFFDKIGIEYDVLRKDSAAIKKIKNYYRGLLKEGEELWWIDADGENSAVSPIIKPFRTLPQDKKEIFLIDCMIFFPEMFGKKNTKFERAAAYLISEYNAVSANLRDHFTAGGKREIMLNGKKIFVPQILFQLHSNSDKLQKRISNIDPEKLASYWRCDKLEDDRLAQWKKLVNHDFFYTDSKVKISDFLNI